MNSTPIQPGTVLVSITMSLDGYVAGPNQSPTEPLGEGAEERLHTWMFDPEEDNAVEMESILGASAYVMGRNMYAGPGPGDWDPDWHGWWGEDPPYHAPVFVVTHHGRDPLPMDGGTTFHFVTDGVAAAVERAKAAAGDGYVLVAGGATVVNEALHAGLVDELWLHVAPVILGAGARLFDGAPMADLEKIEARHTDLVTHLRYRVPR